MGTVALNDRVTAQFTADADQTDFAADFPLMRDSAGESYGVFVNRTRDGSTTIITRAGFDVTAETEDGFELSLHSACQAGDLVIVYGQIPPERARTHEPGGAVRTETLEGDADQFTYQLQEAARDIQRAILVPLGEAGFTLPDRLTRRGHIFEFTDTEAALPTAFRSVQDVLDLADGNASTLIAIAISNSTGGDFTALLDAFNTYLAAQTATQITNINNAGDEVITRINNAGTALEGRIPVAYVGDGGTASHLVVTIDDPEPTEDEVNTEGFTLEIAMAANNAGATDITINDFGPFDVQYVTHGALQADALVEGGIYWLCRDATGVFQVVGLAPPPEPGDPVDPTFDITQNLVSNPAHVTFPQGSDGRRLVMQSGTVAIGVDAIATVDLAITCDGVISVIASMDYVLAPGPGHGGGAAVAKYLANGRIQIVNDNPAGVAHWIAWGYLN